MSDSSATPINSISVDVEDWLQSTIDPDLPLTDRFRCSTWAMLEAFTSRVAVGAPLNPG